MKQTFAAQTFNSKTFASGNWQGVGSAITVLPNAVLGNVVLLCQNRAGIVIEPNDRADVILEPNQLAGIVIEP